MVGRTFSARQQLPIRSKHSGSCLKTCFSLCSLPVLFSQLLESLLSIWTTWESCLPKTISFSQKDSASSDPWEDNMAYSCLHHASLITDASHGQAGQMKSHRRLSSGGVLKSNGEQNWEHPVSSAGLLHTVSLQHCLEGKGVTFMTGTELLAISEEWSFISKCNLVLKNKGL